jgi:arsenate reductase
MTENLPVVLFACVHNAGRSQMAAGWLEHLAAGRVRVLSGGSSPGNEVNAAAVRAMAEVGIDISGRRPQAWTEEGLRAADVVVTMGCGDTCPFYPGKRYEDWEVADPHGPPLEEVRVIRDDIEQRVRGLLSTLAGPPA